MTLWNTRNYKLTVSSTLKMSFEVYGSSCRMRETQRPIRSPFFSGHLSFLLRPPFWGRGFDPRTGRGSLLKLSQFRLPRFASVYTAANEYQQLHCWEGTCRFMHWPSLAFMAYLRHTLWGIN